MNSWENLGLLVLPFTQTSSICICWFSFLKEHFIKTLYFTNHKIYPFKVHNSVAFTISLELCNHHHHLIPEWLHNPKNKPSTQSCHAPFYPPLTLGNPCCLYAMAYFDISYEWNHTYVLLWLASFTFTFKVQSYCSRYQYVIPFCRLRAKSLQLYLTLCDPGDRSPSGSSKGFSRQEYWSGFWITFCCMAISH